MFEEGKCVRPGLTMSRSPGQYLGHEVLSPPNLCAAGRDDYKHSHYTEILYMRKPLFLTEAPNDLPADTMQSRVYNPISTDCVAGELV